MFDFTLTIKNNTDALINTPLFNPSGFRGTFNSPIKFSVDLSLAVLTSVTEVEITVRGNSENEFTTYKVPVVTKTIQGICDALNQQGIGLFWVSGSKIVTANSLFTYGVITIGDPSVPGVDWYPITFPFTTFPFRDAIYAQGMWVVCGGGITNDAWIITSADGYTWIKQAGALVGNWQAITYGNGLFVVVGGNGVSATRIMTSPDAITWTYRAPGTATATSLGDVEYAAGVFVAIANGETTTSPDGITWTAAANFSNNWVSLAYGAGVFVKVANGGAVTSRVATSPDGVTWTNRTSFSQSWTRVVFANGIFMALAISGAPTNIMTSPDGTTWTLQNTSVATGFFNGLSYGDGKWIFVSTSDGSIQTSINNGVTWIVQATTVQIRNWQRTLYTNNIFLLIGSNGLAGAMEASGEVV